jgi:hypothetical protein
MEKRREDTRLLIKAKGVDRTVRRRARKRTAFTLRRVR